VRELIIVWDVLCGFSAVSIPRATFALLHAANFQNIVDRHGEQPDLVDPQLVNQPPAQVCY
jgi:hypothetical protein